MTYNINDTGEADFNYTKKGFKGHFNGFGKIIDIDARYVLFEDHDGFDYLVKKKDFTFRACEVLK